MKNGKRNSMKRMAISAVCVGMIGSGGLVQAMNTSKPVNLVAINSKTGTVMPEMIHVPASKIASLPLGETDNITKVNMSDFMIGKAEVTEALWINVYNWAIRNGYTFANKGANIATSKPVTSVSWYDAIIWANARSEKEGLQPVYRGNKNKNVLKNANDENALDKVLWVSKNSGYQLPTATQWQLAARFLGTAKPKNGSLVKDTIDTKGKDGKMYYWTPSDYASGANKDVNNETETARVAWFFRKITREVCSKALNVLQICDMSGNVGEWQFTAFESAPLIYREIRGGSYNNIRSLLTVSFVDSRDPSNINMDLGFRLAKNVK